MATAAASAPGLKGAYKIIDHTYDVVVVGAGGSGLRATMGRFDGISIEAMIWDAIEGRYAATRD